MEHHSKQYYLGNKGWITDTHNNLDESVKESIPKKFNIVWFHCMTFSKRQNYCDKKQQHVCDSQGLGIGRRCPYKGIAWDIFRSNRAIPYHDCSGGYTTLSIY